MTVLSRKLSDFIVAPIDFLKLDVEGAEHHVLQDLLESGKIGQIRRMVIEYHHHIGQADSCLGSFLSQLESAGFNYQVQTWHYPLARQGIFQDIVIFAYPRGTQANVEA